MSQPPQKPPGSGSGSASGLPPVKPAAARPTVQPTRPGARPGAEPQRPQYGPLLDGLAADLDAWRLLWDRYFGGDPKVKTPPEAKRSEILAVLRQLRDAQLPPGDRFRFGSLEARYNSMSELYARRLRQREEGPRAGQQPVATPPRPAHDPQAGIALGARPAGDAVEALYNGLCRSGGEAPRFDLDSFGRFLQQQVAAVQQKTGCREVQFRVVIEDGKAKLKARPLSSPA